MICLAYQVFCYTQNDIKMKLLDHAFLTNQLLKHLNLQMSGCSVNMKNTMREKSFLTIRIF